ncbi:MAG TPA: TraR/DksA family transcriptional regulator [Polyangiaceae bacterium]|jgi:DnaK suppressor protein
MPPSDLDSDSPPPLTPDQLALLRDRLLAERERIRGSEASVSLVREPRERSAEDMDEAEASLVQHEALGRVAHDRNRLALIERALQKIAAGTYGISELSEEPIGYARLSAVPWARFTAEEQERVERDARRFG